VPCEPAPWGANPEAIALAAYRTVSRALHVLSVAPTAPVSNGTNVILAAKARSLPVRTLLAALDVHPHVAMRILHLAPILGTERGQVARADVAALDVTLTADGLSVLDPLASQVPGARY
jgi:hypothetical protein